MPCNLTVILGTCSSAPSLRVFESGTRLATLQVTVRHPDGPADSVPISVWDPPPSVEDLVAGDEVVAVGVVRRRFYRAASGDTGSQVEVVADWIARSDGRRRASARRRAEAALAALDEAGSSGAGRSGAGR